MENIWERRDVFVETKTGLGSISANLVWSICELSVLCVSSTATCIHFDHLTLSLRRHLYMPSSHPMLTTAAPCWLGRHCPPLMGSSGCWMRQLMLSLVLGSSIVAWYSYVILSCTGWTFLYVCSISLEQPSTGVFRAGLPSTWWTAAHLLRMSLAVSVFALSAASSSSFHDIVTTSPVVGHFLLSAQWPGTLCLTISVTQRLVMTSLEQHWRHFSPTISEHGCCALDASLRNCTL